MRTSLNSDMMRQTLRNSTKVKFQTITDETLIFQQDGDDLHRTAFNTLENKQWVKIWFTGPVTESFPVQGTAGQVVIIE
jgi:hypothetical protein